MNYDLGGINVEFDKDFEFYSKLLNAYESKAIVIVNGFHGAMEEREQLSPEAVFEHANEFVRSVGQELVSYGIEILVENEIYDFDENRFWSVYSDELAIENTQEYQLFLNKYDETQERIAASQARSEKSKELYNSGITHTWGDVITSSLFVADENRQQKKRVEKINKQLRTDQATLNALNGIDEILLEKIPGCFFSIMDERLHKDSSIVLGRRANETTAIFNNLSRVDDEKKKQLLKRILEINPRNGFYLEYLLNNCESLNCNNKAVYYFATEVFPTFTAQYKSFKANELIRGFIAGLNEANGLSQSKKIEEIKRMFNQLLNFAVAAGYIDLCDGKILPTKKEAFFGSDALLDSDIFAWQQSMIVDTLAEAEWIIACLEKGIDNYSIQTLTDKEIKSLLNTHQVISERYPVSYEDDPGHNTLRDFLTSKEKILEIIELKEQLSDGTKVAQEDSINYKIKDYNIEKKAYLSDSKYFKGIISSFGNYFANDLKKVPEIFIKIGETSFAGIMTDSTFVLVDENLEASILLHEKMTYIGYYEKDLKAGVFYTDENRVERWYPIACSGIKETEALANLLGERLTLKVYNMQQESNIYGEHVHIINEISKSSVSYQEKKARYLQDAISYGAIDSQLNVSLCNPNYKKYLQLVLPKLAYETVIDKYQTRANLHAYKTYDDCINRINDIKTIYNEYHILSENGSDLNEELIEFSTAKPETVRSAIKQIWDTLMMDKDKLEKKKDKKGFLWF